MSRPSFRHGGARALVDLHQRHLREFLKVWREAEGRQLELPPTSDPSYASREALLAHVLGAAGSYLLWLCEQLELPTPEVERDLDPAGLAGRADEILEAILVAWRDPLKRLTPERAYAPAHVSRWGPPYCIDAMMEHVAPDPARSPAAGADGPLI